MGLDRGLRLRNQAGLADARFSGDHDHLARTAMKVLYRLGQESLPVFPSDQDSACQAPSNHAASVGLPPLRNLLMVRAKRARTF